MESPDLALTLLLKLPDGGASLADHAAHLASRYLYDQRVRRASEQDDASGQLMRPSLTTILRLYHDVPTLRHIMVLRVRCAMHAIYYRICH